MQFKVNRQNLESALAMLERVADRKGTRPILSGVLVSVQGDRVDLAATNLEKHLKVSVPITNQGQDMSTVVDAKLFAQIVRKLPAEEVTVTLESGSSLFVRGGARFKLATMDAEMFPELPTINPKQSINLPIDEFQKLMGKVGYAAAKDDSRAFLMSVLLELESDKLTAASTDSSRLAIAEIPVTSEIEPGQKVSTLMPAETVRDILGFPPGEEITLQIDDRYVAIQTHDLTFVTRSIDGQFPDYRRVTTINPEARELLIGRRSLSAAIDRASLGFRGSKVPVISIVPGSEAESGCVIVESRGADDGESQESIEVEGALPASITLNAGYVADALRAVDTQRVKILWPGGLSPMHVVPDEGEQEMHVIMPVRVA